MNTVSRNQILQNSINTYNNRLYFYDTYILQSDSIHISLSDSQNP